MSKPPQLRSEAKLVLAVLGLLAVLLLVCIGMQLALLFAEAPPVIEYGTRALSAIISVILLAAIITLAVIQGRRR